MDENTKDILETVNFIKEHMLTKEEGATKDDVRDIIRKEVPQIVREEVKDIRVPAPRQSDTAQKLTTGGGRADVGRNGKSCDGRSRSAVPQ